MKIARLLPILCIAILAFTLPSNLRAQEDVTPPNLVNFGMSATSVDVTSAPQSIVVTSHVTDDLSGVVHGCFAFISPALQQSIGSCLGPRISGTPLDAIHQVNMDVPQFIEPGVYHLAYFWVLDAVGHYHMYSEQDFLDAGFPTQILVTYNALPVADAGPDRTVNCASTTGTPVTLNGSASSDPDGDTLSYTWTGPFPEGGGTVTGVSPTVTLPLGASTITLTVDDGNGGTSTDTIEVRVNVGVEGLLSPLAALAPEGQLIPLPGKAFKRGSTLPLKLRMYCGGSALTAAAVAPPRLVALSRFDAEIPLATVDPDSGEANDNGLLFRSAELNWVYNLSTRDLPTGTFVIVIQLPDGRRFAASFVLR